MEAIAIFQRMVDERHRATGRNLAQYRKVAGLSQEALAHRAGLSSRTISRAENGEVELRGRTLRAVSEALGVTISDIAGEPVSVETQLDRIEERLGAIYEMLVSERESGDESVLPSGPAGTHRMRAGETQQPKRAGHGGTPR